MSTPVVVICILVVLVLLLATCLVIHQRRQKEATADAVQEAARAAQEAVQEMTIRGEMLSAKADDVSKRVDRLTTLLQLTTNPLEQSDGEEESGKRRSATRRRHPE